MATDVAAIYTRKSKGRVEGTEEQARLAIAYVGEKLRDIPYRIYTDKVRSGADPEKAPRPQFKELVEDIRRGLVTHVVVRDSDRLFRNMTDWEKFRKTALAADMDEVHTYAEGLINLREMFNSGVRAMSGSQYVELVKFNTTEALAQRAREGRPNGGKMFGYEHVCEAHSLKLCEVERCPRTLRIVDDEAKWLRWGAEKVLAGWSLTSVGAHWEAEGVPTPRGGRWRPTSVKQVLTSHASTGLRLYKGEEIEGIWAPILDRATWTQLRAKLNDPARSVVGNEGIPTRSRPGARRYLLTGVAVCGKCGTRLRTNKRREPKTGKLSAKYGCPPKSYGGCNGVAVSADALDKYITRALMLRRENPEVATEMATRDNHGRRDQILKELEGVRAERKAWGRKRGLNQLDEDTWEGLLAGSVERESTLNAELVTLPTPMSADPLEVTDRWHDSTPEEQREIVRMWVGKVKVMPGKRGGRADHAAMRRRVRVYGVDGREWTDGPVSDIPA